MCYNLSANHLQEGEHLMRKLFYLILYLSSLIFLASCMPSKNADIVTTAFPQYDFARQIVKDKMTVSLLVNPGQEIHKYEVTSKDRIAISKSKLFIFTSLEIDQWLKDPQSLAGDETIIMDLSSSFEEVHEQHLSLSTTFNEVDPHDHDHDIHYWVDPLVAIELIHAIYDNIILIDPLNQVFYETNMEAYVDQILSLHETLESVIDSNGWENETIYFAGHNALGLFAERYHLNIISIYTDFKPEQDTLSSEMIDFMNLIKESDTHYLMIEELIEPLVAHKIVESLSKESYPLELLELHAYHNVSGIDFENLETYASLFERNINNIIKALSGGTL